MLKRWRISPPELLLILGLEVITGVIFTPLIGQMIYNVVNSDYAKHIGFARDIVLHQKFASAHLMYQTLIIGLSALSSLSLEMSGLSVAIIFYGLTVLILYVLMRRIISGDGWGSWLSTAGSALALLLITPITMLTLPKHNLYYGYIGINVGHNPTIVMLKPFALLLTVFAVGVLDQSIRLNLKTLAVGMALGFLSVFAKPNFALILLPALLLIAAYHVLRRRPLRDLKAVGILLILPLSLFLALDYIGQFLMVDAGGGGGIRFAPLLTVSLTEQHLALLPVKFLLSILFPLTVTLLYRHSALKDLRLKLAWLIFVIGAAQMYLLAEGGDRLPDANFWWSAQIGLFVLFVVSALFWMHHFRDQPDWRGRICLLVFALHLICGVLFYLLQLVSPGMATWW